MSDSSPIIIVGLGNPGSQYADTHHNLGFLVVDELARRWNVGKFSKKFKALTANANQASGKQILLKPQTYMNLSGESVQPAANFYKVDPKTSVLVISDDLDLPLGRLRLRKSGGAGGHNGLKSVIEQLGTNKFMRLRIGIGRGGQAKDHVLAKMSKKSREEFEDAVQKAADAVEMLIRDGFDKAMNLYNQKESQDGT